MLVIYIYIYQVMIVSYIADRIIINSKRMWIFTSGRIRQRRNTNRTATTDPTGETAVEKPGCIPYCTWLPCHGPAQDRRTRIGFTAVTVAQSKE